MWTHVQMIKIESFSSSLKKRLLMCQEQEQNRVSLIQKKSLKHEDCLLLRKWDNPLRSELATGQLWLSAFRQPLWHFPEAFNLGKGLTELSQDIQWCRRNLTNSIDPLLFFIQSLLLPGPKVRDDLYPLHLPWSMQSVFLCSTYFVISFDCFRII